MKRGAAGKDKRNFY